MQNKVNIGIALLKLMSYHIGNIKLNKRIIMTFKIWEVTPWDTTKMELSYRYKSMTGRGTVEVRQERGEGIYGTGRGWFVQSSKEIINTVGVRCSSVCVGGRVAERHLTLDDATYIRELNLYMLMLAGNFLGDIEEVSDYSDYLCYSWELHNDVQTYINK